jgi:hypothetical protein
LLRVKVVISMKIPFSNRTVDVELPNAQGQARVIFPSYPRLLSYYRLAKFVLLVAPH